MTYIIVAVVFFILALHVNWGSKGNFVDALFIGFAWPAIVAILGVAGAWLVYDSLKKVHEDEAETEDDSDTSV